MRRAIATAMSRSKREIPHYYLAHTIDLEPAFVWLERRNAQVPIERRVVYGALLLKAVARARCGESHAERRIGATAHSRGAKMSTSASSYRCAAAVWLHRFCGT